MWLLAICLSSLEKHLFKSLVHFLIGFFLLSFKISLCFLNTGPFSDTWFASIYHVPLCGLRFPSDECLDGWEPGFDMWPAVSGVEGPRGPSCSAVVDSAHVQSLHGKCLFPSLPGTGVVNSREPGRLRLQGGGRRTQLFGHQLKTLV